MAGSKKHTTLLMTADTVGGVWTYCMDLCHALSPFPITIHLVTMGENLRESQRQEVSVLPNVRVYETAYKLEWMPDPWEDIAACGNYLLQLEERISPDIIHLNCFAYGALPFRAPVMVVAHSDVFSWFWAVKGNPPPPEWNRYFTVVQAGLQSAECVVAPSETMLQAIKDIYATGRGAVIYNGRREALFFPAQKQSAVFSMGRIWDEAKNIRLLLQAAPAIKAPVQIAGSQQFAENNLQAAGNGAVFLGKLSQPEIAAHLSTAAVYVLPAQYEPFGLSALEAALSGCALVLGDIPSLREIWRDAALYVNTQDAGALAQTVNTLLENSAACQHWAEKAGARATAFPAAGMAKNYWQLYGSLTREGKRRSQNQIV